ncbi:uncharacterized protein LOC143942188 [Lithobates pipiens]
MDPHAVLVELKSRNFLETDKYESMEKDPSSFSRTLLQDIQDRGREAVIGLWGCLCALQKDHPHPNFLAVFDEIRHTGEGLVDQILLHELGHSLTPKLRDIQEKHKKCLMEKTETLVEHRPPGTTLEPQRFLINEHYVNLIVVSTNQFRQRPQNEIIQTGVQHEECLKETQNGLEHIPLNRLFRWNPQSQCVPHAVMVSGVPGIGKTTMMQKFVYDWVTGKHYQRFAFVFLFRFWDLNKLEEVSLEEMILHQYPYLKNQIGDILHDPKRLLFIFDGLDESIHQIDFRSSRLFAYRTGCVDIVVSLVRQSLLKGCSVLITSRPTRLTSVDTGVFQRIAEIMGFLHGDRLIFFKNFFGNEELSEKAFHYVQENDTLYTLCYIPSYCWIICTVLSMSFRSQPTITDQLKTSLSKTVTQLFVTYVSNILTNHSQNKDGGYTDWELLSSVGWMAEHGVMNHRIVFDERHLESFSVRNDKHLFSSLMMESGQPPDVDYTFLHLILQEFFAALVHFTNYDPGRLQETLEKAEFYKGGRAEIFLRFLCGLSDSSTRSLLKSHVGELSTEAASYVITWIQEKIKISNQRPDKYIKDKRGLLNIFYYLYESRNKALASQCIGTKKVDFSEVSLTPPDCSVLSFILQSCRETEEVNLHSCSIQSEKLMKLIPTLNNFKNLRLSSNLLTDISCPHLASVIRNNQTLRRLDLSGNNLEGPHFRDLMEALTTSRIEELQLRYNDLTDSSCPHLASGIKNNQTLRTLDLSENNLEGPHFRDLMEALTTSQIKELQLNKNNLKDSSCPHLASGIRNNQTLRKLSLSGNNLEGPHFRDLMEALPTSQIEELRLYRNKLTDSSCPHLASGIRNNETLRTLDLSENDLQGLHFSDLKEALKTSQIEKLQIEDNSLSEEIKRFCHQLDRYDDSSLRRIYEYYREDLIYILNNMDPHAVMVELKSLNILNTDKYLSMGKDPSFFSHTLLQDIQDLGRKAVIGLWECLYALQKDYPHPNLLSILDEIRHRGLVEQILLDELGHSLNPEMTDIQEKHKQNLMKKTETLVEHRPPGTTLEPQRFLINERYVNLIVVSTDQFRQRPQNEIIQTGVKHEECLKKTQSGLEHISPNRLFRWNHQSQCVPHAVMLSGVPGIGKTTLMQKFVYDWVTGKHYQRFAFVFFFRFRDLNRLGEVSLEEMILHQYPYLESQIRDILQDPERLLFIFDGLDESIHQMDFRSSRLSNLRQRSHFGEIVVSLVRQSLLKGCSVLITSRPTRLESVDTGVFQRIAEIMGFLHGDRLIFFKKFFGNEELSEKAFHYVQENDTLYTFCYIPSYCWIICTVLSMCFRAQPTITDQLMTSLPKTVTQLFVTFVSNILANHSQNKDGGHTAQELLTSIGRMAEHGVLNHIIVFDERHLESFNVINDNHLFSSFMMESGQPPDVDYSFLHLTLQEFFAALVHFIKYNPDRLQETLDEAESYKDGRAKIFLRFLCGLSDSSTRSMLTSHVGELSTQAARHVITWIQKKIPEQRSDKSVRDNRDLLNVFYYLHESRNEALVSQCIGSNKVDFSDVHLYPLDCSVLSFILQSCRDTEEINLHSCNIQSEGLKKLLPALHNIKSLTLSMNHLTDSSCPHLASGIRNNQTLRTLDLSDNNLEGPHFRDLMASLTKSRIEELQLSSDYLTDRSCPHLASGIRNNQALRTLILSKNKLEGPHFRDLMEALTTSRIEKLHLDYNHLTDRSCPHLASGIRKNQTLKTLILTGNNLKGCLFRNLMEALRTSRIEELQLDYTHLTDHSCPHLASGIRNNQTLRTLNLSYNNLEGPHFRDLMEALTTSQVEKLQLYNNDLTGSSCPHLASGIRNTQTLRKLSLSERILEGPHFGDLMEALITSGIKKLWIGNNDLSDETKRELKNLESLRPGLEVLIQ